MKKEIDLYKIVKYIFSYLIIFYQPKCEKYFLEQIY